MGKGAIRVMVAKAAENNPYPEGERFLARSICRRKTEIADTPPLINRTERLANKF